MSSDLHRAGGEHPHRRPSDRHRPQRGPQGGCRRPAEALAAYLQSEPAQDIFAEEGFRPVNAGVWSRVKGRFAPVKQVFSASDFGGWNTINATFFAKDGVWDQLLRSSR